MRERKSVFIFFLCIICTVAFSREYNLEDKLSQMFILGFKGDSVQEFSDFVSENNWGGYIFYSQNTNILDEQQARDFLQTISGYQRDIRIKPFLAIDMEGGTMQLAKNNKTKEFVFFETPRQIAGTDYKTRKNWARDIASYTSKLGFNLNLAPVVDVDKAPFRNSRSFGNDPDKVIENSKIFLDEHNEYRVLCTLKHFPGRGSGRQRDIDKFYERNSDLRSFQSLVNHRNVGVVMVSTMTYPSIDPDKPAYKSLLVYELLRSLGFQRIALTDDASKLDLTEDELQTEIIEIINAGADMILLANRDRNYDSQLSNKLRQALKNIINQKQITEARIEESFVRILETKQEHGIEPKEIYLNYEI